MVKKIPDGAHTITPHLVVKDGAAIDFYKKAFGAIEESRMNMPGSDQFMHAGLKIGDSKIMLSGEMGDGECGSRSPLTLGGSPVVIHLYVENVDEVFQQAINAGAKEIMKPCDMFWGDRYGRLKDPFGHEWSIATHVRDMTPAEMQAEAIQCFSQAQQKSKEEACKV